MLNYGHPFSVSIVLFRIKFFFVLRSLPVPPRTLCGYVKSHPDTGAFLYKLIFSRSVSPFSLLICDYFCFVLPFVLLYFVKCSGCVFCVSTAVHICYRSGVYCKFVFGFSYTFRPCGEFIIFCILTIETYPYNYR